MRIKSNLLGKFGLVGVCALAVSGLAANGLIKSRLIRPNDLNPSTLNDVSAKGGRDRVLPSLTVRAGGSAIRDDLFGTPASQLVPEIDPRKVPVCTVDLPLKIEPPDPWADQVYVGNVVQDNKKFALIENAKTGIGEFVSIGMEYRSAKVTDITKASVSYSDNGISRQLQMNTGWSLTPLTQNAKDRGPDAPASFRNSLPVVDFLIVPFDSTVNTNGITEKQAKHLQNEIFEGRMTPGQAAAQGLQPALRLPTGLMLTQESGVRIGGLRLNTISGSSASYVQVLSSTFQAYNKLKP